jgi:carbonic anhydrase
MKISTDSIREDLVKMKASVVDQCDNSHVDEWINVLQKGCIQFIDEDKHLGFKSLKRIKEECKHIVSNKTESIFHNPAYISACIVKKLFPDVYFTSNSINTMYKNKLVLIFKMMYD